jgi:DNA-directed RNA polymerase subunit RPC12/RpoP
LAVVPIFLVSILIVAVILGGAIYVVAAATHSVGAIVFCGVVAVLVALPTWWLVMLMLTPFWKYERCPKCGKRKLIVAWAVLANPPTPWFYKCLSCGARYSRKLDGAWSDATSPEFDDKYINSMGNHRIRGPLI